MIFTEISIAPNILIYPTLQTVMTVSNASRVFLLQMSWTDRLLNDMIEMIETTLFTFHFIVPVPIDWMLDGDVPLMSEKYFTQNKPFNKNLTTIRTIGHLPLISIFIVLNISASKSLKITLLSVQISYIIPL